jgi:hypothetical protein
MHQLKSSNLDLNLDTDPANYVDEAVVLKLTVKEAADLPNMDVIR